MKTKNEILRRIDFLEKDYEIAYDLQNGLDMDDEDEAAHFDRISDDLKQTKNLIKALEWVLES